MILIFELVIDIDKGKRHHSFNILIKEKIEDDIISTLFALKFNDFIITGGEYLNFFKFDYEEKKLTFSFKISESTKINKIIAFNENYIKKSEKIFVCDQNGFISLYDIHDNKGNLVIYLLFSQKCHKSSIDNILYLPEENFLISLCNKDLELKFWNINNEGLKSFKNINNYSFNANNNCMINIKTSIKGKLIGYLLIGAKDGIQLFKHKNKQIISHNFYKDNDLGEIRTIRYLGNNYFICGRFFGYCSIFLLRGKNIRKINSFRNNNSCIFNSFLYDQYHITDICVKDINDSKKKVNIRYLIITSADKTVKIYSYDIYEISNND